MSKELEDKKYYLDVVDNLEFAEMYFEANEMKSLVEYLFTPPTAEEVCKALSEYLDKNVYYEKGYFLYRKEEYYNQPFIIAYKYKSGLVELTKKVLPPHLITLIGRFYEGVEVKGE